MMIPIAPPMRANGIIMRSKAIVDIFAAVSGIIKLARVGIKQHATTALVESVPVKVL